jgi:hypothetical protein
MNKLLLMCLSVIALSAGAQETEQTGATESVAPPVTEQKSQTADKKMVSEARINLQTTVTGNQEQPRVMYILPWQSPLSPELEMEMLSSQEESVFGHVERDEMQRNLESSGELDSAEE